MSSFNSIAKKIIDGNIYLTLSTSFNDKPWVSPLFYCKDESYNLYFISQPESLHIKNIEENPHVSFAIFDSHQPEGTGNGIQGSGEVSIVEDNQIEEALMWYKTEFIDLTKENLTGTSAYRLYKLSPKDMFILDPEADTDKRVKVELK